MGLVAPQVQAQPDLPAFAQVKASYRASDLLILDRRGELIQRVRHNFRERRGDWLGLQEISPALVRAVLLSEDRRFHDHEGVDWWAVGGAAWGRVTGKGRGGASTISMQVTDLVQGYQRSRGGRDFVQKIEQMRRAVRLEQEWSKQQILEAYFNLAPWRGELIGVDALSRVLFQKYASGLNLRESALAAAMLRSPNASAASLRQRACALLQEMSAPQECKTLADYVESVISRRSAPGLDAEGLAPHFARWVVAAEQDLQAGDQLITSLDADLQRHVLTVLNRHLHALDSHNVRDGAVVVLDNATGEVIAYVGSSGQLSTAPWVDHARALRQAGSTLKPFLYEQALEQRRLTAASLLLDGPLDVDTGAGVYAPRNYNEGYAGWVSARTALASSMNVPAVRVLTMVGPEQFAQRLTDLGLPLNRNSDFYGYSLALGSAEVTLLSLTNAYRALANRGRYSPVSGMPAAMTPSSSSAQQVMAGEAVWIIGDVLSDPHARARTFGLDSSLATPFWTAVKTGTSKDMRDNWCIGFSARYTVGVWAGNSGGESMRHVSGVSGAGPVWQDVMRYLHGQEMNAGQPAAPQTLVSQSVQFDADLEPARIEYFLKGTEQSRIRLASKVGGSASPSIRQPVDGTILALDPDIPPAHQRLQLMAAGVPDSDGVRWRIGGTDIADKAVAMWMPSPGVHRIELTDANGATLDSVHISVRGAAPKLN